ncbi:MAG: type I-E CRISPR-associated endonuclease Cas1e [Planctomycetota bacterium]
MALKGRLGLESARVPHADRHGLLWLGRSQVFVDNGTLRAKCAGWDELPAGTYDIPFQMVSVLMLAPGCTVTHDVLRLCARHGTGVMAVGEGGVRHYTFPPLAPDRSELGRRQARLWADPQKRVLVARKMYALRFDEVLPHEDIAVLRGIEGARIKEAYKQIAAAYRVPWDRRKYDRANPDMADPPNQAINHAATAVEAAAWVAVSAAGAIPQLGFVHEDSGGSFVLDIADLYRTEVTIPVAFATVCRASKEPNMSFERLARQEARKAFRAHKLIPSMIDAVKGLLDDAEAEAVALEPPGDARATDANSA